MRAVTLAIIIGLTAAPLALAESTGGGSHNHGDHAAMTEGVHTTGMLHAIDGESVKLTHEPIPEIGWPQMTMDLTLLEGAEVGAVEPGDPVMIMLEKGADGLYGVRALMPIE